MKKFLATILLLTFPCITFGAIVEDTPSGSGSATGLNSVTGGLTFSHTATGGANSLLIASCNNGSTPAARLITGVTFNGKALTQLFGDTESGLQYRVEAWYIINPDAGAHNVVCTWNSNGTAGNDFAGGARSFTGVDTVNTFGATTTLSAICTNCGVTVTSLVGDVVYATIATDASAITTGPGLTSDWTQQNIGADSSFGAETVTATTTSTKMNYTQASVGMSLSGVAIHAAAATTGTPHKYVFNGAFKWTFNGAYKMILR